jgi:hypothetical protein
MLETAIIPLRFHNFQTFRNAEYRDIHNYNFANWFVCVSEMWFSYFEEGHEIQVWENKVLMKETEPKKDEANEQFKITQNDKFIKLLNFFGHFLSSTFFILKTVGRLDSASVLR